MQGTRGIGHTFEPIKLVNHLDGTSQLEEMLRFIQDNSSHSSALESCLVDLAQFCRVIEFGVFSSPSFLLPGRVIGIFSQLLEGDLVVFGAIERYAIRWPGFQQQERDRDKRVGMS